MLSYTLIDSKLSFLTDSRKWYVIDVDGASKTVRLWGFK